MKSVNTIIVSALLAIGLIGNATAASSKYNSDRGYSQSTSVKTTSNKKAKYYRVRRGDTLTRIAKRNNISLKKLVRLNSLWGKKANNIQIGMRLRLA